MFKKSKQKKKMFINNNETRLTFGTAGVGWESHRSCNSYR